MGPPSPLRKRSRSRGEWRRRSRSRSRSFSPRRQSRGGRGSKSRSPLGKRRKSPPRHRSPGYRRSRSYSPKVKTERLGPAGRLPRPASHNQGAPAARGGGMVGVKQENPRAMGSSQKLARSPARGGSPKPKQARRSRSLSPRHGGGQGSRMGRASSPDSSRKVPDKAAGHRGGTTRGSHRETAAATSAAPSTSAASGGGGGGGGGGGKQRGKKDRFDQTDISLSQRFTPKGEEEPFVPQENISIGIERNIPGGEQAIILKRIRLEEVVVTRRKDEGLKALHKRPEFQAHKGDHVEERRVIRVVSPPRPSHGGPTRENFEVTRESTGGLARVTLSTGWKGDRRNIESKALGVGSSGARKKMTSEELDRFLLNDTSHPLSHGDRDERMLAESIGELGSLSDRLGNRSPPVVSHFGDRDERLVLEKRLGASNRGDDRKGRDEDFRLRELKERDRYEEDPNDLRHNIRKKRHVRDDPIDARQKILKKKEHDLRKREEELLHKKAILEKELEDGDDPLPDFSQRPDKYMYEEWKDRPEITPKGSSYYEHDNRDSGWQDNRGDRRGGYRGRGGGYPPREYTPRDNPQREYPQREFSPREYRYDNQREGDGGGERDMDRGSERGTYRGRRGYRRPYVSGYRGNNPRGNYRGSNYRGNNYRANYRGGGGYSTPRGAYNRGAYNHRDDRSLEREWKHDKFEELQDEKPSSTT